jgi:hypothetical protein
VVYGTIAIRSSDSIEITRKAYLTGHARPIKWQSILCASARPLVYPPFQRLERQEEPAAERLWHCKNAKTRLLPENVGQRRVAVLSG